MALVTTPEHQRWIAAMSASGGYGVLYSSFKRIADGFSRTERAALFRETAERIYRIGI